MAVTRNAKQLVNEYTQRLKIEPPSYHTRSDDTGNYRLYFCTLTLAGKSYSTSTGYKTKKQAESEAAGQACSALDLGKVVKDLMASNQSKTVSKREPRLPVNTSKANLLIKEPDADCIVVSQVEEVYKYLTGEFLATSFRSLLCTKAQEEQIDFPIYDVKNVGVGSDSMRWFGTVQFKGETFQCIGYMLTRKQAEQSASEVCLRSLGYLPAMTQIEDYTIQEYRGGYITTTQLGKTLLPHRIHSGLLQVVVAQLGLHFVNYGVREAKKGGTGANYIGICWFDGKEFQSTNSKTTTTDARHTVACEALRYLQIDDPIEANTLRNLIRFKIQRSSINTNINTPFTFCPSKQVGWIQKHFEDVLILDGETPNQERIDSVIERKDTLSEVNAFEVMMSKEPSFNGVPLKQITDLAIAEICTEHPNIFVVGNKNFSIKMVCKNNKIFCQQRGRSVEILPGHHIRGLASSYLTCFPSTQVYIRADSCDDLFFPNPPLSVASSCGTVMLLHDHEASDQVYVLLKRAVKNLKFVKAVQSIASYLHKIISGHGPCKLDINSVVPDIDKWLYKDVKLLSEMTMDSMNELFSVIIKYDVRWNEIFVQELSNDLMQLKDICTAELHKRLSADVIVSNDDNRDWTLPTSSFKHRLFPTGVFMESSVFSLHRGMREKTNLKMKLADIETLPYIDVPCSNNQNPHRGDVTKYYIWARCRTISGDEEDTYLKDTPHYKGEWVMDVEAAKRTKINMKNKERQKRKAEKEGHTYPTESKLSKSSEPSEEDEDDEDVITIPGKNKHRETFHDECRWYNIDDAKQKSPIFNEISKSVEFRTALNQLESDASGFMKTKAQNAYSNY